MIVTYFGWFCLSLVCIAAAVLSICLLVHVYGRAMDRFSWAVISKDRAELGREIASSAHWFSTHPEVTTALQLLGARIRDGLSVHPGNGWREDWNKSIKASSVGKPGDGK